MKQQSHYFRRQKQAAAFTVYFLSCIFVWRPNLAAQSPADYQPARPCESDDVLPQGSRLACDQIDDSLEHFSERREELSDQLTQILKQLPKRTMQVQGRSFEGVPMENPLDTNDGNEGGKAWQELSHDSKLALNQQTFMGCMEPRLVPAGPYEAICSQLCPSPIIIAPGCPRCIPGTPGCIRQTHMVIEYYLPMYQVATNKAGARSIDVTMFNGYDNQPKLLRSQTAEHQEQSVKPGVEQSIASLTQSRGRNQGLEQLEWPEYHRPGEELFLQGNNESFNVMDGAESFPIAYQTLLHAHASRDRPLEFFKGWAEEPKSALWCFGGPEKKVIANAMDHGDGVYSLLSRMAEFTEVAWPEAYRATVNLPWDIEQSGTLEELPQQIIPSYRMQRWQEPFSDLSRVGVQAGGGTDHRDWVFYGGTLAPFIQARFNTFTDPVRADIFRMTTAALLFGSKRGSLSVANNALQRLPQFTFYQGRHGGGRQGYTGDEGGVSDSIVFTDKIQLAFPPLKDGGTRTGSQCFRIENLANSEPGGEEELRKTESGHVAPPKDLRTQFLDGGISELNRANETRMIVWTKRVMCACERCGVPYGCNTLNHGDFLEDGFSGTLGFPTPPPPLAAVKPFLDGYARKTSPPPQRGPVAELFDIPAPDSGSPGPNPGAAPSGFAAQPSPPVNPPPQAPPMVPPQLIACLLEQLGLARSKLGRSWAPTASTTPKRVMFHRVIEPWKPEFNPEGWLLAIPIGSGSQCTEDGCRRYSFAHHAFTPQITKGVFTVPSDAKLCRAEGGGRFSCLSSSSERGPRLGHSFRGPQRRLSRDIGDLLGAGNPATLAPTYSGLSPITAWPAGGAVNAGVFTSNFGTFGGNLQTAVANAAQGFGGMTPSLTALQSDFATSIGKIQASVDQLFTNTLGAGQSVTQAVNNIKSELNQIASDIRHSDLSWQDKQALLHQKQQLEQQLEELEEEIDEDEEEKEEQPNQNQQQCGGGQGGEIAQAILQALQGLLSGGGGGGGGGDSSGSAGQQGSDVQDGSDSGLENDAAGDTAGQAEESQEGMESSGTSEGDQQGASGDKEQEVPEQNSKPAKQQLSNEYRF